MSAIVRFDQGFERLVAESWQFVHILLDYRDFDILKTNDNCILSFRQHTTRAMPACLRQHCTSHSWNWIIIFVGTRRPHTNTLALLNMIWTSSSSDDLGGLRENLRFHFWKSNLRCSNFSILSWFWPREIVLKFYGSGCLVRIRSLPVSIMFVVILSVYFLC